MNAQQWDWLVNALIIISKQLNSVQRKLDTLITASPTVSQEQLAELNAESKTLQDKTQKLAEAIEKQKGK